MHSSKRESAFLNTNGACDSTITFHVLRTRWHTDSLREICASDNSHMLPFPHIQQKVAGEVMEVLSIVLQIADMFNINMDDAFARYRE